MCDWPYFCSYYSKAMFTHSCLTHLKVADLFSVDSCQAFCIHCVLLPVWLNMFLCLQTDLVCMYACLFCSSCICAVCNCGTSLQISERFACLPVLGRRLAAWHFHSLLNSLLTSSHKTADEGSVVCSRLFNYITTFCLIIQFLKCQPLSLTCLLLHVLFLCLHQMTAGED